jgi:hypothetical protein
MSGRRDKAHKVLDPLNQLSKEKYVEAGSDVKIYAALGEKDKALRMAGKGL